MFEDDMAHHGVAKDGTHNHQCVGEHQQHHFRYRLDHLPMAFAFIPRIVAVSQQGIEGNAVLRRAIARLPVDDAVEFLDEIHRSFYVSQIPRRHGVCMS